MVPNGAGGRVPFGIRGMPRPTGAAQAVHSNGPMYLRHGLRRQNFRTKFGASVRSSCPTGGCGEPPRLPWVAAHSGAFAARMGGMGGSRSRDHPQSAYQRRTIPQSRPLAVTAPFTQGSLALRGTAPRGVVPYGWLRRAAAIALGSGAQRSVCASGRKEWAGIDARTIPKGGPPPRLPRQRLAKRKARKEQLVKFDFCPMTSECSTAHKVRKSQHGHARVLVGAALIGQDSLAPRPAAREGAPRP